MGHIEFDFFFASGKRELTYGIRAYLGDGKVLLATTNASADTVSAMFAKDRALYELEVYASLGRELREGIEH